MWLSYYFFLNLALKRDLNLKNSILNDFVHEYLGNIDLKRIQVLSKMNKNSNTTLVTKMNIYLE